MQKLLNINFCEKDSSILEKEKSFASPIVLGEFFFLQNGITTVKPLLLNKLKPFESTAINFAIKINASISDM
ncbi:hypothetical protein ACFSSG_12730 [Euzebyella marina]|uniref:hypothetical protein n=1 Tax=Euzebyella marina TaxID=1761453 RepID=UPI00177E54F0|nr:hypothetical protein [Euzebyella marina]